MKMKVLSAVLAAVVAVPALAVPAQENVSAVSREPVVSTATVSTASLPFTDIGKLDPSHINKIQELVNRKIIQGFPDKTFRPNVEVTRGEYAAFISNALDLPTPKNPKSFKDVSERVATHEGIMKAYAAGIINGYPDGRFRPHDKISRGDMAIMLDNALKYKGSYQQKANLTYTDKGSIGKAAYEPVQRLTHYGIMGAFSGNAFRADVKGTRLSTVLSIYELLNLVEKPSNDDGGSVGTPAPVPTPSPSPTPTEPPLKDEAGVITIKGFKFTPSSTSSDWWEDEVGTGYYKELPKYNASMQVQSGKTYIFDNIPYDANDPVARKHDYTMAMQYIIVKGLALEKDDFLGGLDKLRKTNQPVTVKNVTFYFDDRDKEKYFIYFKVK